MAGSGDKDLNRFCVISFGQVYGGRNYIIQANGRSAIGADKMNMVVLMVTLSAAFAQGVPHGIIGTWNYMDNTFFNKCLKRAVNGNAVKFFTGLPFNVSVGQCSMLTQEEIQDLSPAVRYAQVVLA